jgi:hypothetical protein
MELQTLYKRESVADLLSRTYANSPLPSKNNGGAHSVPGCGVLEFGGLENRFQRTCRFRDGEVTTSQCCHKFAAQVVERCVASQILLSTT